LTEEDKQAFYESTVELKTEWDIWRSALKYERERVKKEQTHKEVEALKEVEHFDL